MPLKDPEKRRAYMRQWYARTKSGRRTPERVERERVTKRSRRHAIAEWLIELKRQLTCVRCGEDHPGCIVFHHADPHQKEITIAEAVKQAWSRQRILSEIAKCDILCANCHAKHHAREASHGG